MVIHNIKTTLAILLVFFHYSYAWGATLTDKEICEIILKHNNNPDLISDFLNFNPKKSELKFKFRMGLDYEKIPSNIMQLLRIVEKFTQYRRDKKLPLDMQMLKEINDEFKKIFKPEAEALGMVFKDYSSTDLSRLSFTSLDWVAVKNNYRLNRIFTFLKAIGIEHIIYSPLNSALGGYSGEYIPANKSLSIDPIGFVNLMYGKIDFTSGHETRHGLIANNPDHPFNVLYLESYNNPLQFLTPETGYEHLLFPEEFYTHLFQVRDYIVKAPNNENNEIEVNNYYNEQLNKYIERIINFQKSIIFHTNDAIKHLLTIRQDGHTVDYKFSISESTNTMSFKADHADAIINLKLKSNETALLKKYLNSKSQYYDKLAWFSIQDDGDTIFYVTEKFYRYLLGEKPDFLKLYDKQNKSFSLNELQNNFLEDDFLDLSSDFESTEYVTQSILKYDKAEFKQIDSLITSLLTKLEKLKKFMESFNNKIAELEKIKLANKDKPWQDTALGKLRTIILDMTKIYVKQTPITPSSNLRK